MWKAGKDRGQIPNCWRTYRDFMVWANQNKYKVEYGYKGGFSIESLLAAIPTEGDDKPAPTIKKKSTRKKTAAIKEVKDDE